MLKMLKISFQLRNVVAIAICLAGFSTNMALSQTSDCSFRLTVSTANVYLGNAMSISGGMIITTTPDKPTSTFGGSATLLALPKAGYIFVGWDDGNVENPRVVSITSDKTFNANFAQCEECKKCDDNPTSTKEMQAVAPMKIFPNPVTNILTVQLEKEAPNGSLAMFDMNGKIVLSKSVGGDTVQIDLSALSPGSYILRLNENGKLSAGVKVVKE